MVAVCRAIPFGKQPVIELSSGLVVGYTAVDCIDLEGRRLWVATSETFTPFPSAIPQYRNEIALEQMATARTGGIAVDPATSCVPRLPGIVL